MTLLSNFTPFCATTVTAVSYPVTKVVSIFKI
jgi:hypothetical protein